MTMWHWMLFLTSPMTFTGVRTTDYVFTRQMLLPHDRCLGSTATT